MGEFERLWPDAQIRGVDIVPEFLQKDTMEEMDACAMTFADGEFDLVFCNHTLEHCYAPRKAASELLRVAGRFLFVCVPLEREEDKRNDQSHFFCSTNPMVWLQLLDHPKWRLLQFMTRRNNNIAMLFGREEV
jgi:ubiquinone/menaquinone biosynthesis C-methylase UbiE